MKIVVVQPLEACFTPQCTSRAVVETFELPMQTQENIFPKRYFTFLCNEINVNLF